MPALLRQPLAYPAGKASPACKAPSHGAKAGACAGYGRKEAAQLLLDAGAEPSVKNSDGQTPADAARLNREMHMVTFMEERGSEYSSKYL